MSDLKLTIDLIPKGAWGNNLREMLSQKDWVKLREICYKRFDNKCSICGEASQELDAHEVWAFDSKNKKQTLIDIIALCPKCHGVKHMRNSERIGYGQNAKRHFMKINKCSEVEFAGHYTKAQLEFEELNSVIRWEIVANLSNFGGQGMELKKKKIPFIKSAYNDFEIIKDKEKLFNYVKNLNNNNLYILLPKVRHIDIDNYSGEITVVSNFSDRIEWFSDNQKIATKFNILRKFTAKLSVANMEQSSIQFVLTRPGGKTLSQDFELTNIQ
ncbi:MAG: hypothetical protein PHS59_18305 [Paludibacter sp.]|nr:hypothetical protein [Paludibacter sp.]